MSNKFKFTIDYQWALLKYIVLDNNGERAIKKIKDSFFTLIEHQVIAYALIVIYKKLKKIPGEIILKEKIRTLLNTKLYINLVTKDEQKNILNLVTKLYIGNVQDGDEIYAYAKDFAKYVNIKEVIENIDLNNFTEYPAFSRKIQFAITDEDELDDSTSSLLFSNVRERQLRRKENFTIKPTPIKQINAITNAGGYEKGSILVLLDKQKKGKTAALVNLGRGYVKLRKKVLYIDLENGQDSIMTRFEQSIMKLDKRQILSGEFDDRVQRKLRKYKRIGAEIVIERLPALTTNANTIQERIDFYYNQYGMRFQVLIVDFIGKMGSLSKKDDDTARISDAYIDVANLVEKNNIEHCWTAHHVTRDAAEKRMATKYRPTDTAKALDINRHVQAIFGLNRNKEEEEAGFARMELIEQRDGFSHGRAVFHIDLNTQRMDELSISARKQYDNDYYNNITDEDKPKSVIKKKRNNDLES